MNTAMDQLCDHYTDDQLEVIVDFLQRTTEAGRISSGGIGTSPALATPVVNRFRRSSVALAP